MLSRPPDMSSFKRVSFPPPQYLDEQWDALVDQAQRNAEGLLAKKK